MPNLGGYQNTSEDADADNGGYGFRDAGARRRKFAAMAGSLYRTGQQAVTDFRDSYAQSRPGGTERGFGNRDGTHIPGAFPDAAITVKGSEHLVMFPTYAKRHVKRDWSQAPPPQQQQPQQQQSQAQYGSIRDEDFWRNEWEKAEDEKAIVDVDVRGWLYNPHVGPFTRRNRVLLGLARQLSGITAPRNDSDSVNDAPGGTGPLKAAHQSHEEHREQERIAQEAARIEARGQQEKQVAYQGGYSEDATKTTEADGESLYRWDSRGGSQASGSAPTSPTLSARQTGSSAASATAEMTEAELVMANTNLLARVAPFMTSPIVALPITVFFYNDSESKSRTVMTNDAGHFNLRAALDFVPTHVRILASEDLSTMQEVIVTEPEGVSLISDIDDTIKRSNISGGAREIFRNTFVRELADLTVEGVEGWYNEMHRLGVSMHYCSNSPWQLYPVLASYFKLSNLPPGSLHLKQYSGMLQGIFEPVAERKRSTLTRLLHDFPERRFLLVGDSGEADLEVYTELAVSHPGRVLAIFIRDVTTPEETGFFEPAFGQPKRQMSSLSLNDTGKPQPPRTNSTPILRPGALPERKPTDPIMGDLIDFSDEPQPADNMTAHRELRPQQQPSRVASTTDLLSKKPPPPRPQKPASLRSSPSQVSLNGKFEGSASSPSAEHPPPRPPRKPLAQHPLSQMQNLSQQTIGSVNSSTASVPKSRLAQDWDRPSPPVRPKPTEAKSNITLASSNNNNAEKPPPPPPRRRTAAIQKFSPRLRGRGRGDSSNADVDFDPLPPSLSASQQQGSRPPTVRTSNTSYFSGGNVGRTGGFTPPSSPLLGAQGGSANANAGGPVNRKLELWRRRLLRAHEQLDGAGVALYTWRRGGDVVEEAKAIVRRELEKGRGGNGERR